MDIVLYLGLFAIGLFAGLALCAPTIIQLMKFKAKFQPRERDNSGRFVSRKREMTKLLREHVSQRAG